MNRNEIVTQALAEMERLEKADQYGSHLYNICAYAAWQGMDGGQRECLRQLLFKGPVWDGDICSKAARGDLFDWQLATRVCFKGESGHTAATYLAKTIFALSGEEKPSYAKTKPIPVTSFENMVDRFLAWSLPVDFKPDGGISFDRARLATHPELGMPSGTNLLDATQARAMVQHMLGAVDADFAEVE